MELGWESSFSAEGKLLLLDDFKTIDKEMANALSDVFLKVAGLKTVIVDNFSLRAQKFIRFLLL